MQVAAKETNVVQSQLYLIVKRVALAGSLDTFSAARLKMSRYSGLRNPGYLRRRSFKVSLTLCGRSPEPTPTKTNDLVGGEVEVGLVAGEGEVKGGRLDGAGVLLMQAAWSRC